MNASVEELVNAVAAVTLERFRVQAEMAAQYATLMEQIKTLNEENTALKAAAAKAEKKGK